MAKMMPNLNLDFNNSKGEGLVYAALKNNLPDDFIVFHSLNWSSKSNNGVKWGEVDFLIFNPKYGILIVEVKSGDVALKDGNWYYVLSDGSFSSMKNPMAQANRSKYNFIDITNSVLNDDEHCQVEPVVWFPSIDNVDYSNLPPDYNKNSLLISSALENTEQAIVGAYNYYNSKEKTNISKQSATRILQKIAPEFHMVQSLGNKMHEEEQALLQLTKEQSSLLDFLDEQPTAAIQGGAGTGKTLLAVEKANRLAEDGKVLFLCFNKFLKDFLASQNDNPNVEYFNLQSLVKQKTNFYDMPSNDDITEYLNSYDKFGNWNYAHIVIDEGQDFESQHIDLLSTIAEMSGGAFYVFYDKNQLIQKDSLPEWIKNSDCKLMLRRNCRNTQNIAITANKPIQIEPIMKNFSPLGDKPSLHFLTDKEQLLIELENTINKYISNNVDKQKIVILTAKTEEKSILYGIEKIGKYYLDKEFKNNGVLFTTTRKFKGLEADIIIMIDIDSDTFSNETNRCMFYVASSRAKHFLEIFSCISDEEKIKLSQQFEGNGKPMLKIASALSVKIM